MPRLLSPLSRLTAFVLAVVASTSFGAPLSMTKDGPGAKDHPLLSRFPGSVLQASRGPRFDLMTIVTGHVGQKGPEMLRSNRPGKQLEGQKSVMLYRLPAESTPYEAIRAYEDALSKAGFEILFKTADFRDLYGFEYIIDVKDLVNPIDSRYVSARLKRPEGDVYVDVWTGDSSGSKRDLQPVVVRVLELRPLRSNLIQVDAASMAQEIDQHGHVALYGILFDTDSDRVRPDSGPTIAEMAKYLKANPSVRLFVIGHTDNTGALDHNLDLSTRRAQAVVQTLVSEFGISSSRLAGKGVGPYAPVQTNTTEEGRAKNRRVELVLQ